MESSNGHSNPLTDSVPAGTQPVASARGEARPAHGAVRPSELRRWGLNPDRVLDFSASISPLGTPAALWEALHRVDLSAYPDPECLELREALSRRLEMALECILVGNGSTELIHLLARAYLSPPRPGTANIAFLLTPTYGEYAGAGRLARAEISSLGAHYSGGFGWDMAEAGRRITEERPSLVFICNPNNPTGVYLPASDVLCLAETITNVGGLLVLDEAYLSFVDDSWDSRDLLGRGNVVLLRSMTKDYALTGLRLGYSLASEEVTTRLASYQPDWSVNSLAQAAGVAALSDTEYIPRARDAVNRAKEYLTEQLTALGFVVMPSSANFLLVQVGNGAVMRDRLIRRGLVVRDCASFGLPDCIRIGIRSLPDCERLVEEMEDVL